MDVIDRLKDKRIDVLRKRSVQTANAANMEKRLIHYEGELGVFDYDPNEFDIAYTTRECMEYLRYYLKAMNDQFDINHRISLKVIVENYYQLILRKY